MDDGCAGILAERQNALYGSLCIAKELQGDVFVVFRCLEVVQYLSHLLVVRAAQHKLAVVEGLLGHERESLRRHFQNGLIAEF